MSRVFFDTNVLAYTHQATDARKQEVATSLLRSNWSNGCISTQVLQELYVVITRKFKLAPSVARVSLRHLEQLQIVVNTPDLIQDAISISELDQISFYDGLIVSAARSANCSILFTEDLNPGQRVAGVEIVNPFGR
jgi:predicted nucleic acid-binding protein